MGKGSDFHTLPSSFYRRDFELGGKSRPLRTTNHRIVIFEILGNMYNQEITYVDVLGANSQLVGSQQSNKQLKQK